MLFYISEATARKMNQQIRESDWQVFRKLKPLALERLCERILTEISQISSDPSPSFHQRYLAVYELVQQRDKELGRAFNAMSRSKAIYGIAHMHAMELVADEELADFSEETQAAVRLLSGRG
jgi:hypothetical protein